MLRLAMCYAATETYRKDRAQPPGFGYGRNIAAKTKPPIWVPARAAAPTSIIIHATHGRAGSLATSEAKFLRDSGAVSAHYLVGRDGVLYRILPDDQLAWHAGGTLPAFLNEYSIGIELHAAVREPILELQRAILFSLCRHLIATWHIPKHLINTHREVARPEGRKSDPATWPQVEFVAWRERLYAPA